MGSVNKIIILLFVAAIAQDTNAQLRPSAGSSTSATITSMLSPEQPLVLELEDITISTQSDGTITIEPGGQVTTSGGVTIVTEKDMAPLAVTLSGSGNYVYSITLPEIVNIPGDETGELTISNFTSNASNPGQLSSGATPVMLGATIHVPKAEEEGVFQADADIEVGVNFN